ncbi:MAG: hypothetical protein ACK5KN_00900 [Dysgonomonas sp.]|uniref:hypothetical protein n=1 Tax=Dysgonomonas sp. TaxID=1891233 RepID=UPI003A8919B1
MEDNDVKPRIIHVEDEVFVNVEPDLPAPQEGKVWRRKSDGLIFYGDVYLGKRFHSSTSKLLKTPVEEKPDDYEIVDERQE